VNCPPEEWLTIKSIVRDLELNAIGRLICRRCYFCHPLAPWEP
jgi:hypothetical protein